MIFTNMEIILETNFNNIEKWFLNFTCKLNSQINLCYMSCILFIIYMLILFYSVFYTINAIQQCHTLYI